MELRVALLEVLKSQAQPAMGCTEPVAVALAAAHAAKAVGGAVKRVNVKTDPNIYKNGMGVYVPNTGRVGLCVAAAIGAIGGNADAGLEVLGNINDEHKSYMDELLQSDVVNVTVLESTGSLHIIAEVETDRGIGYAEIAGKHDSLICLKANNIVLFQDECCASSTNHSSKDFVCSQQIDELIAVIETYTEQELEFLLEGALMNYKVALAGLEQGLGLGVGAKMKSLVKKGLLGNDLTNIVALYTAAASDARMHGLPLPVMTLNGSGNQGIVSTVAVYVAAQELCISGLSLLKAIAVSEMLTIMAKHSIGLLSALCSCTIAAPIGAAAGIVYLSGGSIDDIKEVIKSLTADITGAICDGAKPGCALKIASGVSTAVRHALMVLEGLSVTETNGIVASTAEACIRNIGLISNPGMVGTDKEILRIMIDKAVYS